MAKMFAPQYERNEQDWILFPRDIEYRRTLFPTGVFKHPAKNNIWLTEELIDYLTEPGDVILDPFGGTGTTMIAARMRRPVVMVDVEPHYCELMIEAMHSWDQAMHIEPIEILCGDCRQLLPISCKAIITSPPFSTVITRGKSALASHKEDLDAFVSSPLNLANLNPFYYEQVMGKIFKLMADSLPTNGPVGLISRDFMRADSRVLLSDMTIRQASKSGLKFAEWFKWLPPGSAQRRIQESRGASVVTDEDILLFRKE